MPSKRTRPITSREWLSLGVLAVKAAEEAQATGNAQAVDYYHQLANTCDENAEIDVAKKASS